MKILLLVGTGGFIGSALRYYTSQFIQGKLFSTFPYGTLGVNVIGCFIIGVLFALAEKGNLAYEWRLFLATGICGGFTTFSAFSIETISLFREGQLHSAFLYIAASVLLGLAATFAGISLTKLI